MASLVVTVWDGVAVAQEQKSKMLVLKDLPPSVQKTVQDNLKGGAIKTIGKEKEDGIEQYEIETAVTCKARDFNVAVDGRLLVVEEATTIDAIPAAAKAAILKQVGSGAVTTIETFAKPGQPVLYEAAHTDAKGKRHELLVNAEGKAVKE
ncbi:MAG: hypothetical protein ACRD3J_26825 [Thermoanaerobaculia bacterium]